MSTEHVKASHEIDETSVLQGDATGDGHVLGLPLAFIETNRGQSLAIALLCCWLACMLSVYNIYQHLQHYSRPQLQKYIVRILVLVPVYALGSFLSLKFVNQALYFDTLRDCYEAFVVYSFLALVLSFAGGESVCVLKMQGEPDITHAWPLNRCLNPIGRDGRLLRNCKRAAIQFVLIKPLFALLSLVMLACGQYHSLPYQLILTVVYNISYSVALYGLWLFYFATKHILKTFNPVLKFFAVKSVIFLTFWQGGMIDFVPGISNEQSFVWKEFVLCVEMVPFALLHLLAFNANQFKKNLDRLPDSEVLKNMKEVLSLSDLIADAYHNFMPSYRDYMLQRADASGQRRKTRVVFGDDEFATSTSGSESSPPPAGISSAHVPKFVIDDEDDDDDDVDYGDGGDADSLAAATTMTTTTASNANHGDDMAALEAGQSPPATKALATDSAESKAVAPPPSRVESASEARSDGAGARTSATHSPSSPSSSSSPVQSKDGACPLKPTANPTSPHRRVDVSELEEGGASTGTSDPSTQSTTPGVLTSPGERSELLTVTPSSSKS